MSDASDTFRLGLEAADRPMPSYPGDGVGDGQPDPAAVPMATAEVRATDVIVGDLVTEVDSPEGPFYPVLAIEPDGFTVDGQDYDGGCEGHEATTAGRYNGPIGETVYCDGSCLRQLPDPAAVTMAPSGRYGFYRPAPSRIEQPGRPVVQVAQAIARGTGIEWHPTPARYYAETIATKDAGSPLSIDHGQGWALSADDTAAFVAYAADVDDADFWQPAAAPASPRALADGLSALIALTAADLEPGEVAALDAAFRVCQRLDLMGAEAFTIADCRCVLSCADHPVTACSLSGTWHVHPADEQGLFGPCPVHRGAPGDL